MKFKIKIVFIMVFIIFFTSFFGAFTVFAEESLNPIPRFYEIDYKDGYNYIVLQYRQVDEIIPSIDSDSNFLSDIVRDFSVGDYVVFEIPEFTNFYMDFLNGDSVIDYASLTALFYNRLIFEGLVYCYRIDISKLKTDPERYSFYNSYSFVTPLILNNVDPAFDYYRSIPFEIVASTAGINQRLDGIASLGQFTYSKNLYPRKYTIPVSPSQSLPIAPTSAPDSVPNSYQGKISFQASVPEGSSSKFVNGRYYDVYYYNINNNSAYNSLFKGGKMNGDYLYYDRVNSYFPYINIIFAGDSYLYNNNYINYNTDEDVKNRDNIICKIIGFVFPFHSRVVIVQHYNFANDEGFVVFDSNGYYLYDQGFNGLAGVSDTWFMPCVDKEKFLNPSVPLIGTSGTNASVDYRNCIKANVYYSERNGVGFDNDYSSPSPTPLPPTATPLPRVSLSPTPTIFVMPSSAPVPTISVYVHDEDVDYRPWWQQLIDGVINIPNKFLSGLIGLFVPNENDLKDIGNKSSAVLNKLGLKFSDINPFLLAEFDESAVYDDPLFYNYLVENVLPSNTIQLKLSSSSPPIPIQAVDWSFISVLREKFGTLIRAVMWLFTGFYFIKTVKKHFLGSTASDPSGTSAMYDFGEDAHGQYNFDKK